MRMALLADVHANWPALEAILAHADAQKVDTVWFAGDVLGRGQQPIECLECLRRRVQPGAWVIGNHDAACVGRSPMEKWGQPPLIHEPDEAWWVSLSKIYGFSNAKDIKALREHWAAVQKHNLVDFLRQLPTQAEPLPGYWITHAGLAHDWPIATYVWDAVDTRREFKTRLRTHASWQYLLMGHTHVPALHMQQQQTDGSTSARWIGFQRDRPGEPEQELIYEQPYLLPADPVIINPGTVGNPKDNDQRAAYAILDLNKPVVTFYRVAY